MKVTRESSYTVEMNEAGTKKLLSALGRALTALGKLPLEEFDPLVNAGVIDQLGALHTALFAKMPLEIGEEDG